MTGKCLRKITQTVAFNVLYTKDIGISPTYISKHKSIRVKKKTILLIIPNKEKEGRHYLK